MSHPSLTGDLLGKAYALAFFIHGDEEIATRVVVGTAGKLEVAVTAQNKRLYYHPLPRTFSTVLASAGFRRKIWLSDVHLFQRLIYTESEVYERRKEQQATPPGEQDLLVHFIKHLVRITLRRNSFYVALGLSRLLYNYSTAETMEIYNAVVQDPERVKDDYYYRSRKGVLMNELKDRFGAFLRTSRGPRGEERFLITDQPHTGIELVKECLSFFTPWATSCLLPDGFDPVFPEIPALVTQGPQEEPRTEVNRVHALTHPDCYQRLIRGLGFGSPDERLEVPRFFLSQDNGDQGLRSQRRQAPALDAPKLKAIESELGARALRRKKFAAGMLRVLVDGVERGRLDLTGDKKTQFTIGSSGELVEIIAADAQGELLLATRVIDYDAALKESPASIHSIVLEGGQEISIGISRAPGNADSLMMEVTYRESSPARAVSSYLGGLLQSLTAGSQPNAWRSAPVMVAILTLAFLVAWVIGVRLYRQRNQAQRAEARQPAGPGPETAPATVPPEQDNRIPAVVDSKNSPEPNKEADRERSVNGAGRATPRRSQQKNQPVPPGDVALESSSPPERGTNTNAQSTAANTERTRAANGVSSGVSLLEVKRVFVEPVGNASNSEAIIEKLSNRLAATGRFSITPTRDEADAVLKISTQTGRVGKTGFGSRDVSIKALLVNANGDVVWPVSRRAQGASYSGSPANVAGRIVVSLLDDIQRLQRKR